MQNGFDFTSSNGNDHASDTQGGGRIVRVGGYHSGSAAIMPEQFCRSPREVLYNRGAVGLMRAVLDDALYCYQQQFEKPDRRTRRLANEAAQWFASDSDRWPFSFVNICAVLGIEPEYIRRKLKERPRFNESRRGRKLRRVLTASSPVRIAA